MGRQKRIVPNKIKCKDAAFIIGKDIQARGGDVDEIRAILKCAGYSYKEINTILRKLRGNSNGSSASEMIGGVSSIVQSIGDNKK